MCIHKTKHSRSSNAESEDLDVNIKKMHAKVLWLSATKMRQILSPVAKNLNSTYHFVNLNAYKCAIIGEFIVG